MVNIVWLASSTGVGCPGHVPQKALGGHQSLSSRHDSWRFASGIRFRCTAPRHQMAFPVDDCERPPRAPAGGGRHGSSGTLGGGQLAGESDVVLHRKLLRAEVRVESEGVQVRVERGEGVGDGLASLGECCAKHP